MKILQACGGDAGPAAKRQLDDAALEQLMAPADHRLLQRNRPLATSSATSQNEITEIASSVASIAASARPRAERPMRVSA